MVPIESYKVLGILSISVVWLGCAFLVYKWPGKLSMSLSHHAAQTKIASLYYAAFLIPAVTAFYLFMTKWFIPTYHLNSGVKYVLIAGVLGQYVACLVPDTQGLASKVHQVAAYIMSATLAIMIGYIVFSPYVSTFAHWANIVILLTMTCLYGLFLFVPTAREKFLIYQSSYVILFDLGILVVTYIR